MTTEITYVGITISNWVMIFAVILGPIASVQIQKWLESQKEAKERRVKVFKDLMSTRAATLAHNHVSALNMVGLEFHGKKFSKVINAWNMYLDHLNSYPNDDESRVSIWVEKKNDLLSDLLYEMGSSLGFEFDKVHIKKAGYIPKGYTDIEQEQNYIRRSTIEVLDGKRPIPLTILSYPSDPDSLKLQKELQSLLVEHYQGKRPINVKITDKTESKSDYN